MSFDNFLYECWSTVQYDTLKFLLFCCRVKEVITSGLDRFVYDPDKATTLRLLQEHVRTLPTVTTPPLEQWTDCLDGVPRKYNYMSVVEYLVKREVKILQVSELNQQMPVPLPVADKPLVKGYNFLATDFGELLQPSVSYSDNCSCFNAWRTLWCHLCFRWTDWAGYHGNLQMCCWITWEV